MRKRRKHKNRLPELITISGIGTFNESGVLAINAIVEILEKLGHPNPRAFSMNRLHKISELLDHCLLKRPDYKLIPDPDGVSFSVVDPDAVLDLTDEFFSEPDKRLEAQTILRKCMAKNPDMFEIKRVLRQIRHLAVKGRYDD